MADSVVRRMFVGFLSSASLISMFASPLFIIVSLEFPRYTTNIEICQFLHVLSWLIYSHVYLYASYRNWLFGHRVLSSCHFIFRCPLSS